MRKIIFMLLLTTSAMLFAKTEEPKVKTIFSKQEQKVLVAKKTIQQEEKVVKKISLTNKQDISICAVAFNAPVPTNMGALLACLQAISEVVNP
ncbi:hypothetical protein [Chryseobacterium viscerum]|uniref:hypothetical protein n=1 Tax=Chryseobacterium viscerum TaxID=1037377 RepID=UPI002221F5C5|nr:hypothetical protein [Chryseobacterium viscerum]MCW1964425.1 hypothetical protein [Chryseobacterium viscerum]